MNETLGLAVEQAIGLITTYGLNVIGAIAILIIGWWLDGRLSNVVRRALARIERFDQTLTSFFASIVRYLIIVVTVLAVLDQFGIATTSLIAVLGTAGLAIGLAMQGSLSNVAAGVMLLIFRPFRVGDYIDGGGVAGTVK